MTPILLLAITGIFVSVAVLAGFVTWSMLERQSPDQRRIRALVGGGAATGVVVGEPRGALTHTVNRSSASGSPFRISFWRRVVFR